MQEKNGGENSAGGSNQKVLELQQRIQDLEASHNEQVQMINKYKQMSEERTMFSLEVVNKSMLAVDLIRKFKEDLSKSPGAERALGASKLEIDEVEAKIIKCQSAI